MVKYVLNLLFLSIFCFIACEEDKYYDETGLTVNEDSPYEQTDTQIYGQYDMQCFYYDEASDRDKNKTTMEIASSANDSVFFLKNFPLDDFSFSDNFKVFELQNIDSQTYRFNINFTKEGTLENKTYKGYGTIEQEQLFLRYKVQGCCDTLIECVGKKIN